MAWGAEPVGEQLARERVEGYPPAISVFGQLLDVASGSGSHSGTVTLSSSGTRATPEFR